MKDREVKKLATYKTDHRTMTCNEVIIREEVVAYEELVISETEYYELIISDNDLKKDPFIKVFTSKEDANRYAKAIIKKCGFRKAS